jgi:hypothetical protein
MQMLVTIYLSGYNLADGAVAEHLSEYLADGWRITPLAAGASSGNNSGAGESAVPRASGA